ncbi:MAG TPA: glycoside hydrolase family 16 protein [Bacteroidales bacterium]|nr:glycoside hydrolase family 16 protein [Bacteroidales bacterium]
MKLNIIIQIAVLFLLLPFLSCTETKTTQTTDPANLRVEVRIDPQQNGNIQIVAFADNAVEYQLRIGNVQQPQQTNTTGIFHHTFVQGGTYNIDVRAVGATGRFLRESFDVNIVIAQHEVPLNRGFISPLSYEGYNLVWQDEFNGTTIDPDYWVFETGTGCPNLCGWGNNELQFYRSQNAWVSNGTLIIEARRESIQGSAFTSARMKTQGRKSFQYGRIDIRALLPKGQGMWPALWMLGNNITTVGWPRCGEIDIMEMVGGQGRENTVHGTIHWFTDRHVFTGRGFTLSQGTFYQRYHVFSLIWDQSFVRFLVDNVQFHQIDITPDHMTEFHHEFFFIFNIAVGGNWPGSPDATTIFPQQMRVDYVRVFQRN